MPPDPGRYRCDCGIVVAGDEVVEHTHSHDEAVGYEPVDVEVADADR